MRPRHKAAENGMAIGTMAGPGRASMRPRHKAAENQDYEGPRDAQILASMRPRHKAAENSAPSRRASPPRHSFNEAAA